MLSLSSSAMKEYEESDEGIIHEVFKRPLSINWSIDLLKNRCKTEAEMINKNVLFRSGSIFRP